MIYINLEEKIIEEIKKNHIASLFYSNNGFLSDFIEFLITKRVYKTIKIKLIKYSKIKNLNEKEKIICRDLLNELELTQNKTKQKIKEEMKNETEFKNIKKIFIAEKEELDIYIKIFEELHPNISEIDFFKNNYSNFRSNWKKWNGSKYIEKLEMKVCPYCNINYLHNMKRKMKNGNLEHKNTAQLDHFYSKDKYPYLALSIFNLIPCCGNCNHLKSTSNISFYPFEKNIDKRNSIKFEIKYENKLDSQLKISPVENEIEISIEDSTGDKKSKEILLLEERYNDCHKDIPIEIITRFRIYNEYNIKESFKIFYGKNLKDITEEKIQEIVYGTKYNEKESHNKSLSKLKNDLLENLKNL